MSKSCEQRLITKEHIAMFSYKYISSPALYSSTLVIKSLKAKIHYRAVFFYKLRYMHGTPTFITEALRLVSIVQLVKCLLL